MLLAVEAAGDAAALHELEDEWNRLADADPRASLFATFDFVTTVWEHFHSPRDRLLVLVLREGREARAIVPLRLSIEKVHGIPLRTIRYISEWEGDRPGIVSVLEPGEVWASIQRYLAGSDIGWDVLVLAEQERRIAGQVAARLSSDAALAVECLPDATGYAASLSEPWESETSLLDLQSKKGYRRRLRRLRELLPDLSFDCYDTPDNILPALERFIEVENRSWKKEALIGVGKSDRQISYYRALLSKLAEKQRAAIFCLTGDAVDISACIMARFKRRWYGLQIAFDQRYAASSPGYVLVGELLRTLSGGPYDECDMLAMHGQQSHKAAWATITYETARVNVVKKMSRALPLLLAQRLKAFFRAPLSAATAQPAPQGSR